MKHLAREGAEGLVPTALVRGPVRQLAGLSPHGRLIVPEQPADDDRVALPLDPLDALRGLLAVDPDAPPADEAENDDEEDPAG